ncbi:U3 small nucleolar RNA-associated protein 25-like [Melia azedarach]|uniref:U3 small nucleolar RNA-associated protein 25-like n=1 Tax=Melia azedarach TaxID=155640 RepID=A0ACC1XJI0_MELAZ|nr:U3 small nucleolar RNA-associated protein 25-like [Melia azedarach]
MGKQFGQKRGLKGRKMPHKFDRNKRLKKTQHVEEKLVRSPSPSSSEDAFSEESGGGVTEEVIYKEPSVYDNLLMKLGRSSESVADAYKMRQRQEEGRSDSEEDEVDGFEPASVLEQEDDDSDEGTDNEPGSHAIEGTLQEPGTVGSEEQNEDAETDSDCEASDTNEEHGLGVNGQSSLKALAHASSFNEHFGYKLSKEEVDNLSKKKGKYKWEVPAVDMSNCKWMGTGECFLQEVNPYPHYGLKPKLYDHWLDIYKTSGGNDFHSSKQISFFSLCNSYRDILHSNKKPFYLKGLEEDSNVMDSYLMHSLNHIFRTRDLVTKNDAKVAKNKESAEEDLLTGDVFLDRGFTRPKVLLLLPLRSIALNVVKRLIRLTPNAYKVNVEHFDRFCDEFGAGEEEEEDNNDKSESNHGTGKSNSQKSKPSDFQLLFGGNKDDDFAIGIKFTRKSIKLYNDFYSSDVIVASPINLLAKIGKTEKNKELDVDYLSSIEVLIIDHADVISMQNWSFLTSVVEQLNCIPSKQHGTDVMRIRQWYLDGYAKFYRQTIVLSYYPNPDINAFFNHHCANYQGKVKLACEYKGVLPKVLLNVRQIYERFNADSIADVDDARLEYFTKKVFPKIKDSVQGGIMLFISSYFEFVRLRNFLKSQNASFCLLGDYTEPSDISRARVWFFEGKRKMMLYTERAHFYHRYKIRGIQNLIIYSLPERKEFYPEIVNMLEGSHNMTCTVLFSLFDMLRLERIVGSGPAKRMVKSEKGVFVFC